MIEVMANSDALEEYYMPVKIAQSLNDIRDELNLEL